MNFLGKGFQKFRALQRDGWTNTDRCYWKIYHHHHHHHHHADIYNAPTTTKQEHRCSTKIQIVVDETYWTLPAAIRCIVISGN